MSNTDLLSSETTNGVSPSDRQESESSQQAASGAGANGGARRRGGLSGMVLAELRQLAGELGIDTTGLRKGDLIAAIKERQGGAAAPRQADSGTRQPTLDQQAAPEDSGQETKSQESRGRGAKNRSDGKTSGGTATASPSDKDDATDSTAEATTGTEKRSNGSAPNRGGSRRSGGDGSGDEGRRNNRRRRSSQRSSGNQDQGSDERGGGSDNSGRAERTDSRQDRQDGGNGDRQESRRDARQDNRNDNNRQDDDERGNRRSRRFRDRRRGRGRGDNEPEVRDDDVLLPVAGILDVLENYAFVRTSGYLAGPNDVYVSLSLVRKYGLRRGDAIKGVVRQPREGEQQRQKFNPLVRVDAINGLEPEAAKKRSEFHKLTPLYPNERLRLETDPQGMTSRVIDLVMPVGKGQRALIVSPPKAGKTMILQSIANSITTNNPECHLMVVLADERPEEVTDMQRSVKGEVIASTFDRPPSDHTTVAELSIERAKRLVEMGHDVVVLLDSITRLGRAYNLSAPASGRILSGGVDSTALYPPKRFLGAARNIENGGSLTIFATALVETGSAMDTVIFEEFKGTGNAELKLDRKLANKQLFPAVDVDASSTRKDELLMSSDELAVHHKLRRVLAALDTQQALELVQDRLRKTRTNIEFLTQVAKTTPGKEDE
ncbi:transcription termination factor Rho [Actinopolyspora erythraea]|uniref:Transcription termination factor Rho n=1 Tax=Actinopolyspora erythraea TaxID=414996 RepID=A0A099D3X6_9ACTN|nr:transcription termination factor Rho [Actinopolyspora erythraea]ASU77790.1 transcription termination factor Rho [Actinopolyspora erythraea]KGI80005.1 transcription termination factor Rho [Actinopolyspora erythraea]